MRFSRNVVACATLLAATGCRKAYAPPETPMPANTILLSQMMRELSAQPGFNEGLIAQIDSAQKSDSKHGPALLTPKLADDLRKRILGNDWSGLDRFPGWTMREINPTVRTVGHFAGKDEKLEATSAVHPGAPPTDAEAKQYLDLGPYTLDKADTVSLDQPSTLPTFTTDGLVSQLGAGVTRGDGANDLAPEHAESQRIADVLNRLAANKLDGTQPFSVEKSWAAVLGEANDYPGPRDKPNMKSYTPEQFVRDLQATGHEVTVQDARYFANFGHFHYKGQDVMMPFFVNSGIKVPGTLNRPLFVPVSHAEYEWHIRGPHINADVSYYFGIDGKSEWRTMDTLDQPWVLKRNAHTYTGADAVEVTRLAGLMTVAYMRLHVAYPHLPFGGYYALGVCQDGVSAIEHKMTGHVTLFPNTADASLFNDPRDAEINALIAAIPKDREGALPGPERIFGSLPTDPGPQGDFGAVTIPGLREDLAASYAAWKDGTLTHVHSAWKSVLMGLFFFSAAALGLFAAAKTRKFLDQHHTAVQRNPRR